MSPNEAELSVLHLYVKQLLQDGQGESIIELGTGGKALYLLIFYFSLQFFLFLEMTL